MSADMGNERPIRTYRGRSLEELIPRIRADLGPDAIILREREGLTGGFNGFFQQRCVEVDAQAAAGVDFYDDDEDAQPHGPRFEPELEPEAEGFFDAPPPAAAIPAAAAENPYAAASSSYSTHAPQPAGEPAPAPPSPAEPQPGPVAAEPPAAAAPEPPAMAAPEPPAGVAPAPAAEAPGAVAPPPAGAPTPAGEGAPEELTFAQRLAMAREERASRYETADEPEPEPGAEPPAAPEAPAGPQPPATPEPPAGPEAPRAPLAAVEEPDPPRAKLRVLESPPAPEPAGATVTPLGGAAPRPAPAAAATVRLDSVTAGAVARDLVGQGISEAWAHELIVTAAAHLTPFIADGDLRTAVRAAIAGGVMAPPPLPATGAAVAFVGSGGSGKTRCTAALAAAYARASTLRVEVLALGTRAADVEELLLGQDIPVRDVRGEDAAQAVARGREEGLVVIDTATTSPVNADSVNAVAQELEPLALDAIYMTLPATMSATAARWLLDGLASLRPSALVITHADEARELGIITELAYLSGLPIAFIHGGLDLHTALSATDPAGIAARVLA